MADKFKDTELRISKKTCRMELEGEAFVGGQTIGWFTIMPARAKGFLKELEKRWNEFENKRKS